MQPNPHAFSKNNRYIMQFFSHGFRAFFGLALLFAALIILVWLLILGGSWPQPTNFTPQNWHAHEIIFGYTTAVITGFLFTAVPNWTGRLPIRGWPLFLLVLLWLVGRFLFLPTQNTKSWLLIALVDGAFLPFVAMMIGREIILGENWRNLIVLIPVSLLAFANILYHTENHFIGQVVYANYLGLAIILFLITLIGGRIIPSFTRNYLAAAGATRLPVVFDRFDRIVLFFGAGVLLAWVFAPNAPLVGGLLFLMGGANIIRLIRWRGANIIRRSAILLMLHLSYLFIPLGLFALGGASMGWLDRLIGVHLLGIGAVGGMTSAVMMRASMGHTGRPLQAGFTLSLAYGLILASALVRAYSSFALTGNYAIYISGFLWIFGFSILWIRIFPWLVMPRINPKRPSTPRPPNAS